MICQFLDTFSTNIFKLETVLFILQENTQAITKQQGDLQDWPDATVLTESDMNLTVERELVSQAEEEDMDALLGTYVL